MIWANHEIPNMVEHVSTRVRALPTADRMRSITPGTCGSPRRFCTPALCGRPSYLLNQCSSTAPKEVGPDLTTPRVADRRTPCGAQLGHDVVHDSLQLRPPRPPKPRGARAGHFPDVARDTVRTRGTEWPRGRARVSPSRECAPAPVRRGDSRLSRGAPEHPPAAPTRTSAPQATDARRLRPQPPRARQALSLPRRRRRPVEAGRAADPSGRRA